MSKPFIGNIHAIPTTMLGGGADIYRIPDDDGASDQIQAAPGDLRFGPDSAMSAYTP